MKTTIEISDPLMDQAPAVAAQRGQALKEIVEEGLRIVVEANRRQKKKFRLPDRSVPGKGLRPGLSYEDWGTVLERAFGSRK
jgi:hypothetical protein